MSHQITLAGCIISNSEGEILLLHRNTPKRKQWETPGGKIEIDENPETTAEREVLEELGVKVEIIKKLGEHEFSEDGFTMHYTWYQAIITQGQPKIMEEKFDDLRYLSWESMQEVVDQLSPNTKNLLDYYLLGNIKLS